MGKDSEEPNASRTKPMREDAEFGLDGVKRWFYGGTPPADAEDDESDRSSVLPGSHPSGPRPAATAAFRTPGRAPQERP
jgi:hypothetical protein